MALPLAALLGLGTTLIDTFFEKPEDKAAAKLKLVEMQQKGELADFEARAGVVLAEAKSEHWLTANWRPITMLTFVAIIGNNYLLYPYLTLFWSAAPVLDLPPDMWDLLKIGLGGYVVGRSAEKTAAVFRKGQS